MRSKASKIARDYYEQQTDMKAVTNNNAIGSRYSSDIKKIQ